MSTQFNPGQEVDLKGVKIYARYGSDVPTTTKTGKYYIWSSAEKNGRVRITNTATDAGVPGQIIGWAKIAEILGNDSEYNVGDEVIVNGDLNTYADGTGYLIHKENTQMFIVELLDANQYTHFIGVGSAVGRSRIGWAKPEMVKKVI